MKLREKMIDVTLDIIDGTIIFDEEYLKQVAHLKAMYLQVLDHYNGDLQAVRQFMQDIRHSPVTKFDDYTPVLRNFYLHFRQVIDYSMQSRQRLITQLLYPIHQTVIKYDYYFENQIIDQIKSFSHPARRRKSVNSLSSYTDGHKEYYIAISYSKVIISDYKRFQEIEVIPGETFDELSAFLDKFVVLSTNHIYVIDFNTGEVRVGDIHIDDDHLTSLKILPHKIIFSTYQSLTILNRETLEVESIINTEVRDRGLVVLPNKIVTLDSSNSQLSFWDLTKLIKVINITQTGTVKYARVLEVLDNKLMVGFASGLILIVDTENNSIIRLDEHDDPISEDEDILRNIYVQDNNFIVHFIDYIRLYDKHGTLKKQMESTDVQSIFFLPNNQIMGTGILGKNNFIRIFDLHTGQVYWYSNEKDNQISRYYNATVSPSGKLLLLKVNGDLLIYK